jgi:hypothetical protein
LAHPRTDRCASTRIEVCALADYASSPTMYLSLSLMGTTLSTVPSPVVSSAIESGVVSIVVSSSWPGVRREKQRVRIERAYEEVGEWLWGEVGGVRWVGWVGWVSGRAAWAAWVQAVEEVGGGA